jgi:hypothetical protein
MAMATEIESKGHTGDASTNDADLQSRFRAIHGSNLMLFLCAPMMPRTFSIDKWRKAHRLYHCCEYENLVQK